MIKEKLKKYILPIAIFILLLSGMIFLPNIPILLFNIKYDNLSMTFKAIYMFLCDLVFITILFFLYKNKITKDLKDYIKNFAKRFEESFKFYFIGLIIMIISNFIITFFLTEAIAANEEAVRNMIDKIPLYMIFSVSIYAPFVEEIIFRHSIKDCVMCYNDKKTTKFIYILISGFIFAFLHMPTGTTNYTDYIFIIPYMSLGVAFAALYSKTNNIFSSISMHCLHNTFTIVLYLLTGGAI